MKPIDTLTINGKPAFLFPFFAEAPAGSTLEVVPAVVVGEGEAPKRVAIASALVTSALESSIQFVSDGVPVSHVIAIAKEGGFRVSSGSPFVVSGFGKNLAIINAGPNPIGITGSYVVLPEAG